MTKKKLRSVEPIRASHHTTLSVVRNCPHCDKEMEITVYTEVERVMDTMIDYSLARREAAA